MSDSGREVMVAQIRSIGVLPILRLRNHDRVEDIGTALHAAGLHAIEVTLDHPRAFESIAALSVALGGSALLGAGTVRSPEQVSYAREAGARFVVSPGFDRYVVEAAHGAGMLAIPGVLTPTEIDSAVACGVTMVKLFPAGQLGPGYLQALRGPYPATSFVPTGGISASSVVDWLAAGAAAVGVGSDLVGDNVQLHTIAKRAQEMVAALRRSRLTTDDRAAAQTR